MELRDFLRILRLRWRLIVLIVAGVLALAALYSLTRTPVYAATAQSYVATATTGRGDNKTLLQDSQYVLQQIKSYAGLVDSPLVLDPVIEDLGLETTPQNLAARVSAATPADTALLDVTVSDGNPTRAVTIANAVSKQLADVIERVEPDQQGGGSPIKVTLTDPAVAPAPLVSPRVTLNMALALVAGLLLGAGAAVLRDRLDTSVKTPEDLASLTGAAPLGVVAADNDLRTRPLVALDRGSPKGEPYRTARARLQFVDVDDPPRRVVVTSARPGEGKSVTACNLAIVLAQAGASVCFIEADLRRPKATSYLGVSSAAGLTNVLAGQHTLDDVLIPWQDGLLTVLPAGTIPPDPGELLASQQMRVLAADLAQRFQMLVIDAPPLLPVEDAAVIARTADAAAIVVARSGHVSYEQLGNVLNQLDTAQVPLVGTVLTFVPRRHRRGEDGYASYTSTGSPTAVTPAREAAAPREGSGLVAGMFSRMRGKHVRPHPR